MNIDHQLTNSMPTEGVKCIMCNSTADKAVTIPCGHIFCYKCLTDQLTTQQDIDFRCPNCQSEFLLDDIVKCGNEEWEPKDMKGDEMQSICLKCKQDTKQLEQQQGRLRCKEVYRRMCGFMHMACVFILRMIIQLCFPNLKKDKRGK